MLFITSNGCQINTDTQEILVPEFLKGLFNKDSMYKEIYLGIKELLQDSELAQGYDIYELINQQYQVVPNLMYKGQQVVIIQELKLKEGWVIV